MVSWAMCVQLLRFVLADTDPLWTGPLSDYETVIKSRDSHQLTGPSSIGRRFVMVYYQWTGDLGFELDISSMWWPILLQFDGRIASILRHITPPV